MIPVPPPEGCVKYSLFIRVSLANPPFPCPCPTGILGNLSSSLLYSVFFISVKPTGKYGTRLHLWKSKVTKIALVGARIHLQNGQRDVFIRGLKSFATQALGVPTIVKSPLTSGFFLSTHHTNLMTLAWGLLKWKMARKNTYKDDTYQV